MGSLLLTRPNATRKNGPVVITSHINKLPPELLSRIFHDIQEEKEENFTEITRLTTQWLAILRVCSYWRDVAHATPLLWRTIEIDRSMEWLKRCLTRSATAPLRLRFHHPSRMATASRLLVEHARRIQGIRVSGRETVKELKSLRLLLVVTLPVLEELQVYVEDAYRLEDRFVLPQHLDVDVGHLPAIRTLKLEGVRFPWTYPLPRYLHTLELRWTSMSLGLYRNDRRKDQTTLSDILDALEACQSLEHIALYCALPRKLHGENQRVRRDRFITWPNLRSALIGGEGRMGEDEFDTDAIRPVLEHIRFPERCDFRLEIESDVPSPYTDCLPDDPLCIPHLEKAVEAAWNGPRLFSCRTASAAPVDHCFDCRERQLVQGQLRVDMDVIAYWRHDEQQTGWEDRALADFCRILGLACLKKLAVAQGPSAQGFVTAFWAFPAVTELSLEHDFSRNAEAESVHNFLFALAGGVMPSDAWNSPMSQGSGPKEGQETNVPLRNLRSLRLLKIAWYDDLADDIERCLWSRVAGGAENLNELHIYVHRARKWVKEERRWEVGPALSAEKELQLRNLERWVDGPVMIS
ncbi:hypothetical protein BD310DRAFT_849446, partial [Dichomitus squalens]